MRKFNIRTLRSAPSMNEDRAVIQADNYSDAVKQAQDSFLATGRRTTLCADECGIYWLHHITADGLATDRNINSGIPTSQQLR